MQAAQMGHTDDDHAARLQDTRHGANGAPRLRHMFQHLDANGRVIHAILHHCQRLHISGKGHFVRARPQIHTFIAFDLCVQRTPKRRAATAQVNKASRSIALDDGQQQFIVGIEKRREIASIFNAHHFVFNVLATASQPLQHDRRFSLFTEFMVYSV
jgi:hypothetical protein